MPRPVVLALLVLALSGCSTPEKSGSLPALSPGSSPSAPAGGTADPGIAGPRPTGASDPPSSVASAVVKPPEADRPDAAGAEAFARYWIDELNSAYLTLNASRLTPLSSPACQTCQAYIASLKRDAAVGAHYVGGTTSIRSAVPAPVESGKANVLLNVDDAALLVYDAQGHLLQTVPADVNATLSMDLERGPYGWAVSEITQQ